MDADEVTALFTQLDVLRTGHFRLTSGRHSDTYVQCALALQRPDVALRLGRALADAVGDRDVDVVASPALGGVLAGFAVAGALDRRFVFTERGADRAMLLRRGQAVTAGERVLVVEDVVTTGGSALEVAELVEASGATVVSTAALVDRSGGLPPSERPPTLPVSLLSLAPQAWAPQDCPLCQVGTPLDSPGSRHAGAAGGG